MSGVRDAVADVLVVGAGPTGLTLACELGRHGASCRVVDADGGPTPPHESRALAVWERTLEVFESVGVIGAVLAKGKPIRALNVNAEGRRLVRVELDPHDPDTPYPVVLALPQGDTERALLDRLTGHGLSVEWETRLTDLRQDDDGVIATVAGADGGERTVRARWLVGCDGARSVVRHALGLRFEGAEYPESFLLADARVSWDVPDGEAQLFYLPEGGAVAAFPLPGEDRWRLIDVSGAVETDDPGRIAARFEEHLRAAGFPRATVTDVPWTSSFRIHRRIVDRFRVGRVFVAGDAAHIHSPAGGQGMNTGIQDAHNLAWKLALVASGRARDALLDSYGAERRPVATEVLKQTDRATKLVTVHGVLSRHLRDQAVKFLGSFESARRKVVSTLSEVEIDYRDSPAVGDDRAGLRGVLDFGSALRPGDRAPDVRLDPGDSGGPARLFEALAGTRHTLLVFPGTDGSEPPADQIEAVENLALGPFAGLIRPLLVTPDGPPPAGLRWRGDRLNDRSHALQRRFGAGSPCLDLIRPDGHIAYRAQPIDADKLRAYLDRLFVPVE
jgi:2-polyprenyl-6-methoxyphenol hydroxylase-like FAD-dependent oxidoreductase